MLERWTTLSTFQIAGRTLMYLASNTSRAQRLDGLKALNSNKRPRRRARGVAAVVCLTAFSLLGSAIPANAATTEDPGFEVSQDRIVEGEALAAATSSNEIRVFDADTARKLGASEVAISDYGLAIESYGWTVIGKVDASVISDEALTLSALSQRCSGASGYTGYFIPIGYQFALNSCQTSQFIAIMGLIVAGGGLGTGIALLSGIGIPAGAAAGILVGIAGVGTAFLGICQAFSSNGAIYINSGTPSLVPPSCWGQ
jgi:hypothetical protein